MLTKLGTYLVLKRIWNPIDFQGHRSRGQIFRRGNMPRFALLLFNIEIHFFYICIYLKANDILEYQLFSTHRFAKVKGSELQ
jgi:hypothetical protein